MAAAIGHANAGVAQQLQARAAGIHHHIARQDQTNASSESPSLIAASATPTTAPVTTEDPEALSTLLSAYNSADLSLYSDNSAALESISRFVANGGTPDAVPAASATGTSAASAASGSVSAATSSLASAISSASSRLTSRTSSAASSTTSSAASTTSTASGSGAGVQLSAKMGVVALVAGLAACVVGQL